MATNRIHKLNAKIQALRIELGLVDGRVRCYQPRQDEVREELKRTYRQLYRAMDRYDRSMSEF